MLTEVTVRSIQNGPNLVLVDGKILAALCRCGASSQKPNCDGTQKKVGFTADSKEFKWSPEKELQLASS